MQTHRIAAALSDRYVIEREIGAGGMATVYLAHDVKHDRDVALKILRADLSAVLGGERFLNEVRITARLDHPHILTLIDSGEADGVLFYVLPFVRGESLRAKLEREKQLGLDEALSITRQIASALDYAHAQGVVHRDIKPENILLHEGEAMLADFGIAIAVKEAGGNRLTETGLSLGTPQYMSPEQATGDRKLDARSDVYSLAAVLYEMLAGEPPVTGPTAQAMIAKLITERPTRLRVVRDTVPEGIDTAVAKALAKVPADRFGSAGEMMRALVAALPTGASAPRLTKGVAAVAALIVLLVAAIGWLALRKAPAAGGSRVTLRDRTQLTFTGQVQLPSISPDGKQLAYIVSDCRGTNCAYGIEIKDVGGTATRSLFSGATAVYDLSWSPDRRNLLVTGSIRGRYGAWLVSTVGGSPQYVTSADAAFFAGGDSLLFTAATNTPDTVHWIYASGLDAVVRDSIRVTGILASGIGLPEQPSSSRWIFTNLRQSQTNILLTIDRSGKTVSRVSFLASNTNTRAAGDAVFCMIHNPGSAFATIIRVPYDPATGALAQQYDTVYTGDITGYGVTTDGANLVVDEGTAEYSGYVADFRSLVRGALPAPLVHATTGMRVGVSPDGKRVMISRAPTVAGAVGTLGIMPAGGGAETALPMDGLREVSYWTDSVHIALAEHINDRTRLSLVDVRNGRRNDVLMIADTLVDDITLLEGGGWAWIPSRSLEVMIQRSGESSPRRIAKPDWFISIFGVGEIPRTHQIAIVGWDAASNDTLGLGVIDPATGAYTPWMHVFGEDMTWFPQPDGAIVACVYPTAETVQCMRVRGPGRVENLGTIPRRVWRINFSDDARMASLTIRERHSDAWMSRIVR